MKMIDGRHYVYEKRNVKCIRPENGISTNFDIFDKRIFLAGPITGAPNWQDEMVAELTKLNDDKLYATLICNPRRSSYNKDFEFSYQVNWDQIHIHKCNIVLFYIPEPIVTTIKGGYAKTTMYELSEMLHTNKYTDPDNKIIIAMYSEHPMYEYVKERIFRMGDEERKNILFITGANAVDTSNHIQQVAKIVME